ncbi:hypothetical protein LDENG_00149850 [Lucifuga dentata]|nr:hypothetical protein LDENG_00149850 [Lucifuga dentata]
MKIFICAILFSLTATLIAKKSLPKVQVYSRKPGDFGKDNKLICHERPTPAPSHTWGQPAASYGSLTCEPCAEESCRSDGVY